MKKTDFYQRLSDIMLLADTKLEEQDDLAGMEEFDSLAVMQIVALLDAEFSTQLSEEQFKSITTVGSLMEMIGLERFE